MNSGILWKVVPAFTVMLISMSLEVVYNLSILFFNACLLIRYFFQPKMAETLQMSTHNICFEKYSLNTPSYLELWLCLEKIWVSVADQTLFISL